MSQLNLAFVAMLAATLTVIVGLGLQIWLARKRQSRFDRLELIPNILMTRYPILFVGRRRSLFRAAGDFLELPMYLSEHGFLVEEIEDVNIRTSTFKRWLDTSETPVHLVVPEALASEAHELAFDGHTNLATLTILGQSRRVPHPQKMLKPARHVVFEKPDLKPSAMATTFAIEEKALGHMVSLAEHDLR